MLASVDSAVLEGVDGRVVSVEVHVSNGLPGYTVVGLPDAAGRESRERVRAAMLSSGLAYPMKRVTVNLAPASIRKAGSGLELAVALGISCADGGLPAGVLDGVAVLGELGLDGAVRPVAGTLALVDAVARAGAACVIAPAANAAEAALVPDIQVHVARSLGELHACLNGEAPWPDPPEPERAADDQPPDEPLDLIDVHGLANARLALSAAAAGGHHLLLVGPPVVQKWVMASDDGPAPGAGRGASTETTANLVEHRRRPSGERQSIMDLTTTYLDLGTSRVGVFINFVVDREDEAHGMANQIVADLLGRLGVPPEDVRVNLVTP